VTWVLLLVLWQGGEIVQLEHIDGFHTEAACEAARSRFETAAQCGDPGVFDRVIAGFCQPTKEPR
jgi:hypothetical protein